jgi:PIN domain nuclease of toxin-antitoxin system
LLLDTHIVLWWLADDPLLSAAARAAIADPASDIFVSAATVWEIAIKTALGKLTFPVKETASILDEAGFTPLGIDVAHAVLAGGLPAHHSDPFDRMLIAQASCEGLTIVTADPKMKLYQVPVFEGANL